jgi:hypothetical protein
MTDEQRHDDLVVGAAEIFAFEFSDGDGTGGYAWLTLLADRAMYWAALLRPDEPLVVIADLEVRRPPKTLEIRAPGLWADHICETPWTHWSIGNEAHGVALDDPDEALGRAYGVVTPVAFDLEWEAGGAPVRGAAGYAVPAVVYGEVLVDDERIAVAATGRWWHRWGPVDLGEVAEHGRGRRAPVRLPDGRPLEITLVGSRWESALAPR